MPQRRPEVATVKTRSLAASLNGELVFLFSVQKLLFVQDFRSISLQGTHLSVFSVVFCQDWLLFFCYQAFCVTTAAHVFRACNVTTCFWNLTLCKFAIGSVLVELKTVGKFSNLYFGLFLTIKDSATLASLRLNVFESICGCSYSRNSVQLGPNELEICSHWPEPCRWPQ